MLLTIIEYSRSSRVKDYEIKDVLVSPFARFFICGRNIVGNYDITKGYKVIKRFDYI